MDLKVEFTGGIHGISVISLPGCRYGLKRYREAKEIVSKLDDVGVSDFKCFNFIEERESLIKSYYTVLLSEEYAIESGLFEETSCVSVKKVIDEIKKST